MSRILVVGGYGAFGGRLARRLAANGHEVLIGGRSLQRAAQYCAAQRIGSPLEIDRAVRPGKVIAQVRPDVVIDAAGPFQSSDYGLAEACIAAGVHYLDLADGRAFVAGINALDDRARKRGVVVISGASSVPSLSQAVVAKLQSGMERVDAVEIAISASSRASAGASVATAVLGGVGQPIRLWRGRHWDTAFGWQMMRREQFALPSGKRLPGRRVALADVPDLALLPERMRAVASVTFRAGTESMFANRGLWIASWLVRWRLIPSIAGAGKALIPLHQLSGLWGSDRSGMVVRLFGVAAGKRVERCWTLIAERGDGPEIPALAATLLAGRIAELPPGAFDAGGLLDLVDFDPLFRTLAIEHATVETPVPAPLYARVMGPDFDRLDPVVRSMHDVNRSHGGSGEAIVRRGSHPIARLIACVLRFPPPGDYPLHVGFEERNGVERWTRNFGGHRFQSRLSAGRPQELIESFGPLRFHFRLATENGRLAMILRGWSIGPLPMPRVLSPRVSAHEWDESGTFRFDVAVSLPMIGPIVHYVGQLRSPDGPVRS